MRKRGKAIERGREKEGCGRERRAWKREERRDRREIRKEWNHGKEEE